MCASHELRATRPPPAQRTRGHGPPIYVETRIGTVVENVWRHTQDPALHARWDLRFTDISYLPRAGETEPQRFLYETRIGFGLRIRGEGESVGTRADAGGVRTSALRFWSEDSKSLIRSGSGYWQYIPVTDGVRFLTRYDYETRFGLPGRMVDRAIFRPLLGWATAWSFDRLRLWLEDGVDPSESLERSLVYGLARGTLAGAWLYQGLVPKVLFPDSGELAILRGAGLFGGAEPLVLALVGGAEIAYGLLLLVRWRARWPLWAMPGLLVLLLAGASAAQPALLVAPFNPITLTATMAALAGIGLLAGRRLPTAARCLRHPPRARESRG